MQKAIILTILAIIIGFISISCSKDEVNLTAKDNREVKYEITGNFSGSFIVVATTNTDQFEVLEVTKLPWNLEFTAKSSISTLTIIANGTNGKAGETASLKTYLGGKEIKTGGGTAGSSGALSMSNSLYVFK